MLTNDSMGCATSSSEKEILSDHGNLKAGVANGATLPEPPAPIPVDPRLPLTAKQRYSIQASWKAIARNMEGTGVTMFIGLFKTQKEFLKMFSFGKDGADIDELANNPEVERHATIVIGNIDKAIHQLHNLDEFFALLKTFSENHSRIKGFQPDFFWKIEKPFLNAVKETLGDRYTENIQQIYETTIKFILTTLVEGCQKAKTEETKSQWNDAS